MRLIVALRAAFMGPGREECSFLFLVEGRGREGLGLHHDGDVHAFWLQLEGRRTVTLGAPVARATPQDLPHAWTKRGGFTTRALPPGSLLYLPPRTPHRVVCYERSLALSLTWSVRRQRGARPEALAAWDAVSGRVPAPPPFSRTRVWTQIPVTRAQVPRSAQRLAGALGMMASFTRSAVGDALPVLLARGIVAPQDLPRVVIPDAPAALDGWRFA